MTWRKTGSEFDGECAHVDLSDAAYRTHQEAIGHVFDVSAMDCTFSKKRVRNFTHSDHADRAIQELIDHGFWIDEGTAYRLVHHADVIKASLVAQEKTRVRTKKSSATFRKKHEQSPEQEPEVTGHVTDNADRQTDRQLEATEYQRCPHGIPEGSKPDSYFTNGMSCSACARERKSA